LRPIIKQKVAIFSLIGFLDGENAPDIANTQQTLI